MFSASSQGGEHMLDPDIEGRLKSLQREHLAAVFDFMFGERIKGFSWPQHMRPEEDRRGLSAIMQTAPDSPPL